MLMEALKLLVDKLSQYNFLTNILPGTVLCLILKHSGYDIISFDNWYLTGISLIALLYKTLSYKIIFLVQYQDVILLVCLLVLFGFSYRKQTNYIRKRVEANQ